MIRQTFLSFAAILVLGSCESRSAVVAQETTGAAAAAEFGTLLQKGDYAGAIAFVNAAKLSAAEKDGVTGNLILDGLVDPRATTKPPFPLAEGFTRLERAAAAGRKQSIADLRAKFTTGLNFEGKNSIMPPNASLAGCWNEVASGSSKASACIEMRKKLRVP
jgi:hypothetical protein